MFRQIRAKYHGSVLGLGWTLRTPLPQLGVYTHLFRYALRIPGVDYGGNGAAFVLDMPTGLAAF